MKLQIKNNFDRAADSYDDYALIQKLSSKYLAAIGMNLGCDFKTILDIGCGTGNTSVEFLTLYKNAVITLCDISEKMMTTALQKIPSAKYIICDAENYNFQSSYDLGISNLSLQWFEDLEFFLSRIMNSCKYLAFSILTRGSFKEYRELFGFHQDTYYGVYKLEKIIAKYGDIIVSDYKTYDMYVENAIEAARYFRYIGADYTESQNARNVAVLLSYKKRINLKHNILFVYLARHQELK